MVTKTRKVVRPGCKGTLMTRTVGSQRHVTIYPVLIGKERADRMYPVEDFTTDEADVLVLLSGWARRTGWIELEPGVFVAQGEKEQDPPSGG